MLFVAGFADGKEFGIGACGPPGAGGAKDRGHGFAADGDGGENDMS